MFSSLCFSLFTGSSFIFSVVLVEFFVGIRNAGCVGLVPRISSVGVRVVTCIAGKFSTYAFVSKWGRFVLTCWCWSNVSWVMFLSGSGSVSGSLTSGNAISFSVGSCSCNIGFCVMLCVGSCCVNVCEKLPSVLVSEPVSPMTPFWLSSWVCSPGREFWSWLYDVLINFSVGEIVSLIIFPEFSK